MARIGAVIRVVVYILFAIGILATSNTVWQHYHCQTPWYEVRMSQVQGCERDIQAQIEEYGRLAGGSDPR